jgi:hypothetical protein
MLQHIPFLRSVSGASKRASRRLFLTQPFKGDHLYETQSTRIRVCGSPLHFVVSTGCDRRRLLWESRLL